MFGALALVAVRKEQRQARETAPFGFAGADELIDDDLRSIAEVTELAFPNGQAVRFGGGEAVFETHHRFFRQHRVRRRNRRLAGGEMLQRYAPLTRALVLPP